MVASLLMPCRALPAEMASGERRTEEGTLRELEGMRPGMGFGEMNKRFRLQDLVPLVLGHQRRYILEATRPLPRVADEDLEARGIDRLELVFRDERLISVRVGYAGRAELLFDDMAEELTQRFGEPSSVIQRGPMQVGRAHGIRLYLWLIIWTWEAGERILNVEGKHYGVDKVKEHPESHEYVFTLKEADGH
jgi:hypothetical protein